MTFCEHAEDSITWWLPLKQEKHKQIVFTPQKRALLKRKETTPALLGTSQTPGEGSTALPAVQAFSAILLKSSLFSFALAIVVLPHAPSGANQCKRHERHSQRCCRCCWHRTHPREVCSIFYERRSLWKHGFYELLPVIPCLGALREAQVLSTREPEHSVIWVQIYPAKYEEPGANSNSPCARAAPAGSTDLAVGGLDFGRDGFIQASMKLHNITSRCKIAAS